MKKALKVLSLAAIAMASATCFTAADSATPVPNTKKQKEEQAETFQASLSKKAQEELKRKREAYRNASPAVKSEFRSAAIKKRELRNALSPEAKTAIKTIKSSDVVEAKNPKVKAELEKFKAEIKKIDDSMSDEAKKVKQAGEISPEVKAEIKKKRREMRKAKSMPKQ